MPAQAHRLAHLALPHRAHANTGNDVEFIFDVRYVLNALPELELAVLVACADRGYGARRCECRTRKCTAKEEMEVDNSANTGDKDDAVWKDEDVNDETCLLETYLSESHIWQ